MPQTITTPDAASRAEEARAEAQARGINAGWSDANYSAAYGDNYGAETFVRSAARQSRERYGAGTPEFWAFVHGYAEGVERYQADQWQDGTSRHDESDAVQSNEL